MNLEQEKAQRKDDEIKMAKAHLKLIRMQRDRWEFADLSEQLAFDKNMEDVMLIADAFSNWLQNAEGAKKVTLTNLWLAIIRISVHFSHLEVICKKSVLEYRNCLKEVDVLNSKVRMLELENKSLKLDFEGQIHSLKSEIEFLNKV